MKHTSKNQNQTIAIAKDFAGSLRGGDIVLLHGDLGAGKTTFTKGVAEALGAEGDITSPTFTLMNVYPIQTKKSGLHTLVHIDTYRLENEEDLIDIGAEDYLGDPSAVCLVEWPEKIKNLLQGKKVINIFFEHKGENERNVEIKKNSMSFRPSPKARGGISCL